MNSDTNTESSFDPKSALAVVGGITLIYVTTKKAGKAVVRRHRRRKYQKFCDALIATK